MTKYERHYPLIKNSQMKALEKFITLSEDASEFTRRALIFLLRHTNRLSLSVHMSMLGELGRKVQNGVYNMNSSNGYTHLWCFFHGMGTKMSAHSFLGFLKKGKLYSSPNESTIWISMEPYSKRSKAVFFDEGKINDIELLR